MYGPNRSRSESGSSESSRGSGNSGRSRHRSHRPRGCRGGSNRRRNINCDGKKNEPLNTASCNYQRGHAEDQHSAAHGPLTDDPSYLYYHQSNVQHHSLQGEFYGGDAMREFPFEFPFEQPDYTVLPPAPSTDGNQQNYNERFPQLNKSGHSDLSLRVPYTDSSSEPVSGQHTIYLEQRVLPRLTVGLMGVFSHLDGTQRVHPEQILPPLPSNSFHKSESIPSGPNPYALKLSATTARSFLPKATISPPLGAPLSSPSSQNHDAPSLRGPLQQGIMQPQNRSYSFPGCAPALGDQLHQQPCAIFDNKPDNEYRAERLEKQRQNVEGGSLFVTSPRSFLMGLNKSSLHDLPLPAFAFATA